jgi:hypothetical protein
MEPIHERFHELDALGRTHIDHLLRIRRAEGKRLFAQHMLPGSGGRDGPLAMEMIGERYVDSVDVISGQEFGIAPVRSWDIQLIGNDPTSGEVTRSDGDHLAIGGCLYRRDHLSGTDMGGAEDAPAHSVFHVVLSSDVGGATTRIGRRPFIMTRI